jgi:hypothetical protein
VKSPTAVIHFETQRDNKTRWVRQAQAEKMKLAEWVEQTLNRRCHEKPNTTAGN